MNLPAPRLPVASKKSAGFTLIELIVVMVILGILATIAAGAFTASQQKGRDARRKADLKQISNAMEIYFNDHNRYPDTSATGQIMGCGADDLSLCDWGEEFSDSNSTIYMSKLPSDDRGGRQYYYDTNATGSYYQLYARLENDLDSDIPRVGEVNQVYQTTDCGAGTCNFGVSSPNSTPEDNHPLIDDPDN